MIRSRDKIFAEVNNPNTVLSTENLEINKLLKGANKFLINSLSAPNGLLITDNDGNCSILEANIDNRNKILVTDNDGNLTWIGG